MGGGGGVEVERFVRLALACVAREYPTHVSHVVRGPGDLKTPRELTPAFWGCFDWHSAVHSHWLLARAARLSPHAPWAADARAALARSLTVDNLTGEVGFLRAHPSFERPYGLAWLLALDGEVARLDGPTGGAWAKALHPLAEVAVERLSAWLPKLSFPVRTGTHSQTAFSLGLALDWARVSGHSALAELVRGRALAWHAADRDFALWLEPSGEDFLSPSLGVADLMRRVLSPDELARWLDRAMPGIAHDGNAEWLVPVRPSDRSDGRLAHLDGLSLSRAWMLEAIAGALPASDGRLPSLLHAARAHAEVGLAAVSGERYEGAHWLGSFATYLVTAAWRG